MLAERKIKYVIREGDQVSLINEMLDNPSVSKTEILMKNKIMTRTIFQVPGNADDDTANDVKEWLRVRVGDINCNGDVSCTITIKSKSSRSNKVESAKLEVEDYYEAIHMFDLLKLKKLSEQQTKRTKIVCNYENVKYIICFDTWPGLEDMVFLTVEPGQNAEDTDIAGFLDMLNIDGYSLFKEKSIDVDEFYKKKYSCSATFIPKLKFGFDIRIPQSGE